MNAIIANPSTLESEVAFRTEDKMVPPMFDAFDTENHLFEGLAWERAQFDVENLNIRAIATSPIFDQLKKRTEAIREIKNLSNTLLLKKNKTSLVDIAVEVCCADKKEAISLTKKEIVARFIAPLREEE